MLGTRRPYPPGQHGQGRIKLSEYAVRLREKQKIRRIYGILEKQFRKYYFEATRRKGRTGEEMLGLLESRLDNVVHRLGFASTRPKRASSSSTSTSSSTASASTSRRTCSRPGDKVEIRETSRGIKFIAASLAQVERRAQLSWLELDKANFAGAFKGQPVRDELNEPPIREQLIVEYYSR